MGKLYFGKKGVPILKTSFCMFLDVLGFQAIIERATSLGTADNLLSEFYSVHSKSSKYWKHRGANWAYKCFTDNVVFGCPPLADNPEGDFGAVFNTAGFHQLEMTLAGFFIRGGMTFGPLHMSDNFVFGKALIDAYNLESKTANFPRIILDEQVMKEVYEHFSAYTYIKQSPHDEAIFVDEDGQFFLNYLDPLIDGDSAEEIDLDKFKSHRDLITNKLATIKEPHILEKYKWAARYHNHVIDRQVTPRCESYKDGDDDESGPYDMSYLKISGHPSQSCLSLSEFMKEHAALSRRFSAKLR